MASFSPRFGAGPVSLNPFELANNYASTDDCMHFLGCGPGSGQMPGNGFGDVPLSQYFGEDSDFLHSADFPACNGAVPLAHRVGSGYTTSADFLNGLGGCEGITPRVFPGTVCGSSPSLPESYPCEPGPRVSSPAGEHHHHHAEEEARFIEEVPVVVKAVKAKGQGAKRTAPAQRGGSRKGAVTKAARGGRKAAADPRPPPRLLYTGSIGGCGTIAGGGPMQTSSLPWALSLEQLNRQIVGGGANGQEGFPPYP